MTDKKRGFLGRLFKGKGEAAQKAPVLHEEDAPLAHNELVELTTPATPSETAPGDTPVSEPVNKDTPENIPESVPEADQPSSTAVQLEEFPAPVTTHEAVDVHAPEPSADPLDQEPEAALPSKDVQQLQEKSRNSWLSRLKQGLSRSSNALTGGISAILTKRKLDADTLEDLEDILIQADLGVDTAMTITERLSDGRFDKEISENDVRAILAEEVEKALAPAARPLEIDGSQKPHVILMVGVNGTGKTTTIGKLSARLASEGKKVMLAAGDTFRAAAVEQLKIWGERTGAEVVSREEGADAAGLAFDAMTQARDKQVDVLLIDTAGRLQNRTELMDELEKIIRVIKKQAPEAPHSVLLTLDATTGQNAMSQVEIFGKVAGVTGLVMTKLDGTARGGILVAIAAKYALPVHFIGVGEGMDNLEPFAAKDFAAAIAGFETS